MKRPGGAAFCFFCMLLLLLFSALSFREGNPRAGGVQLALAALFFAGGVTLARGA